MKKTLVMACSVIILAALAISGTIAYFTDSDDDTNVFTVGNVVIKLNEEQRALDGKGKPVPDSTLEPFEDNKNLMPLVGTISDEEVDGKGLPTAKNFQDKIVTVSNIGKNDAYVRVYVGIPKELDDREALHFVEGDVYNDRKATGYTFTKSATPESDGKYNYYSFTLNQALPKDTTTGAAIVGFYLDPRVNYDNGDGDPAKAAYYIGSKRDPANRLEYNLDLNVNIPVYVQAVQTTGFADAETALREAFKETPWGGNPAPTPTTAPTPAPGDEVDLDNLPASLPTNTAGEYTISNARELFAFAKIVNGGNDFSGKTVRLTQNISLSDKQNWTPIGTVYNSSFAGIFDGGNHTISYMTILGNNGDNCVGLFGLLRGTVKNLKIANAEIIINATATSPCIGFMAGTFSGSSSSIKDCSVTNSTLNFKSISDKLYPAPFIGGIAGLIEAGNGRSRLDNCRVSNCTITGTDGSGQLKCQTMVGGIVGWVKENNMLEDCTVSNCILKGDGKQNGCKVGGIAGSVYNYEGSVSLTKCKVENGCKIYGTVENRTGTIAGGVSNASSDYWSCDSDTTASKDTRAYYKSGENYTEITDPKLYN